MQDNENTQPKYRETTSTCNVYQTSKKSFGVNIPIKVVRGMSLKKGETIQVTFKKLETN